MIYALYKKGVWVMTAGSRLERAKEWQDATEGSEIVELTKEKADNIASILNSFEGNKLPFWACIR